MTVDVWKGTLKCTVSRARHDETCSLGGNGNCSNVDTFCTATCHCMCYYVNIITIINIIYYIILT